MLHMTKIFDNFFAIFLSGTKKATPYEECRLQRLVILEDYII